MSIVQTKTLVESINGLLQETEESKMDFAGAIGPEPSAEWETKSQEVRLAFSIYNQIIMKTVVTEHIVQILISIIINW